MQHQMQQSPPQLQMNQSFQNFQIAEKLMAHNDILIHENAILKSEVQEMKAWMKNIVDADCELCKLKDSQLDTLHKKIDGMEDEVTWMAREKYNCEEMLEKAKWEGKDYLEEIQNQKIIIKTLEEQLWNMWKENDDTYEMGEKKKREL